MSETLLADTSRLVDLVDKIVFLKFYVEVFLKTTMVLYKVISMLLLFLT